MFLSLSTELDEQGVSRKVSADMFGMALRAYLRKIQRLRESRTDQGRSLWEGVLAFVRERGVVTRHEVIERFVRDDEELLRGVLHDLTESGLVFRAGSGGGTGYRAASAEEQSHLGPIHAAAADELIWLVVYRQGPVTREALVAAARIADQELDAALARLVAKQRIRVGAPGTYVADEFVIPLGHSLGWEAAVLDHYQAVVKTVCMRLDADTPPGVRDHVGGSTYTFDVWPGHPMEEQVRGWLRSFREEAAALRRQVEDYNARVGAPEELTEVVVYGGQCLTTRARQKQTEMSGS